MLVASGSNDNGKKLYINSKQLTGSYAITGSLNALYIGGDELKLVTENDDAIESAGMGVVDLLTDFLTAPEGRFTIQLTAYDTSNAANFYWYGYILLT